MEKSIKKLFLRAIVSLFLFAVILLVIALFVEVDSIYSTILFVISLIPCTFYIVNGVKLLKALEIDKFYSKFL
ncbi:hypothetical protein SAMN05216529_103123 [Faecalicatena contorta]|uniref:Uncharacterized protein n=1 Tax=Faecalicatena contorta TaxID=39482 RepID=A0A316ALC5_9FIRM|nr:hypothetical protein A8805_103123 [Faecalicatena contorta]SUQ13395.1 hypothetical protein SAMN05216529_103123 [Faecalicatena contorta]